MFINKIAELDWKQVLLKFNWFRNYRKEPYKIMVYFYVFKSVLIYLQHL